ncbi:MAG TPA: DUF4097 family beta strand repeat-containing protein [Pyrinomonadaceae bacterium]|nr:DUF4097 family beta strand repeat-containing protein [Pyrinomonadaceae bacterium]
MISRESLTRGLFTLALVCTALAGSAAAQDFQKSYPVGAGATIQIKNVSGDVNVRGYDGEVPTVAAYREGRDRELVEIVDTSDAGAVRLGVRYPRNCNCDASVRFEVRLPRNTSYRVGPVSTASGNVEVSGVSGEVQVSTASGNVAIKGVGGGSVRASTASGNVEAEITRTDAVSHMNFSTASGDVNVRMPGSADATVSLSTASGSVSTDFPIEVHKNEHGPGGRASGRIGSGAASVRLSSASGNVNLSRM